MQIKIKVRKVVHRIPIEGDLIIITDMSPTIWASGAGGVNPHHTPRPKLPLTAKVIKIHEERGTCALNVGGYGFALNHIKYKILE